MAVGAVSLGHDAGSPLLAVSAAPDSSTPTSSSSTTAAVSATVTTTATTTTTTTTTLLTSQPDEFAVIDIIPASTATDTATPCSPTTRSDAIVVLVHVPKSSAITSAIGAPDEASSPEHVLQRLCPLPAAAMTTTTAVSTVTPVDTRPCVTADADQPLLPPLPPLEPSTTCEHPSSILVIDPSTGTTATTAAAPIAATAGAAHDTSYTLITPAAADAIAAAAVTTTPTKRAVVWAALLLYMLMIGGAQVLFRMQVVLYGDTTTFALSTYVLFVIMGSVTAQSAYVAYQMAYLCRSATPKPRWVTPVQGFLSGVLSLTGLALYLVMTSDGGEASVLSPLTALFIIIPLAYGVLGLGDRLNVPRTLGVVLALLSAVLFAMSTGGSLQFSGRTILLFVLAVVAWGVCTLLYQVFSLKERHEYAAGYLGFVGGVVTAALVVAFAAGFPLPDFHFSASHAIVYGGGMCRGIGSVTFFLLARAMPQEAAVVAPISSLYVMLPVVVGMGFLGEAVDAWKLGGVAASVLGVLLMGVRDWSTVLPCLYRHRRGARHAKTAILPAVVSAGTLDLATATDNGGVGVGVHARDVLVAPATTVTTAIAAARLPSSALDPPSSSSSLSSSSSSSPSPTPLTTATTTGTSTPTAAPDARSIAGDIDMCERPLMAAWVAHDACGQHTTLATTTAPTTARAPRTDRGASIIPAQSTPTAATSATMTAAASPASVQRQRVPWWRVRTSKKGSRRATVEVLKDVAPNGVAAAFDDLALERQQQHEEEEKDGCSRSGGGGGGGDGEKGMEGVEGGGSRAPRRHGRAHCHDDGSQSGQNNGEEIIVSEELRVLTQLRSHMFRPRRARRGRKKPSAAHNQASIAQALEDLSDGEIKRAYKVPPLPAVVTPTVTVKYTHAPIFIGGRYNKLVRGVSQTPWFIGSGRRGDTSVQELVTGELEALVKTDEVKFSSAGREDCDVRMLGTGRPFVLEFVNPRRIAALTADVLAQHQADVNGMEGSKVRVRDLRLVDKSDVALLHEGQEKKKKTYACPIWTETPLTQQQMDTINSTQDLLLHQKTPMRVCHRRTLMTRERLVHRMHIQPLKPHFYLLELCTQSGTYIKEFVHGDLGRTTPNMRSILGCNVDILSLDVVDVDLAWPPKSASSSSPAPAPVQAQERAQEAAS